MKTFNAGDKVRCISVPPLMKAHPLQVGQIYTVKNMYGAFVSLEGSDLHAFGSDNFELVVEEPSNRHPHADLIIEWAETGCEIEYFSESLASWVISRRPAWDRYGQYRKSPERKFVNRAVYPVKQCKFLDTSTARYVEGMGFLLIGYPEYLAPDELFWIGSPILLEEPK